MQCDLTTGRENPDATNRDKQRPSDHRHHRLLFFSRLMTTETFAANVPTQIGNPAAHVAACKAAVWQLLQALPGPDAATALAAHSAPDAQWTVSHPLNELQGPRAVAEQLYAPLQAAFPDLERRTDIFISGAWAGTPDMGPGGNPVGGGQGFWCSTTGHYLGTFKAPWLGIPATGEPAALRFGEFYRWVAHDPSRPERGGHVVEARVLLDVVDLARQAGLRLLPPSSGLELWVPGPQPHNGVLLHTTDASEGQASMNAVMAMIAGLFSFDGHNLNSMGMERFWHPNMMWYGPGGIGTSRGVGGFQRHHQRPFLHAFPDRRGAGHRCRIAEGCFVASTGWPSVLATHAGSYLGVPASGVPIRMRVMDWWRRDGMLLAENWVLIDLPHLMQQMGVDVLAPLNHGRAG
jgi:hypothetical protein